jgi:hypothetical protein
LTIHRTSPTNQGNRAIEFLALVVDIVGDLPSKGDVPVHVAVKVHVNVNATNRDRPRVRAPFVAVPETWPHRRPYRGLAAREAP